MMLLADLQTTMDRLDVKLAVSGDKLIVDAPAGVLTSEITSALKVHKPALLAKLAGMTAVQAVWPPRPHELASWPIPWRERWGVLSNALEDEGVPFPQSEVEAFRRVEAEINEAELRGEKIAFVEPRQASSDAEAAAPISEFIWDGTSLADSLKEAREWNARASRDHGNRRSTGGTR